MHVTEDSIKASGPLPDGLKRDPDFLKEAFRLEPDEISNVIKGKRGCYIAHMISKTPVNEDAYAAAHSTIYKSLVGRRTEALVRNWVRELRIAAGIKDYRYRYFRDF